jgi:hypothetical protein
MLNVSGSDTCALSIHLRGKNKHTISVLQTLQLLIWGANHNGSAASHPTICPYFEEEWHVDNLQGHNGSWHMRV